MMMFIALAATAAAVSQPAPKSAPTAGQQRVAVSYADLNLGDRRGVSMLRHRVLGAATTICGAGDVESFPRTLDVEGCRNAIMTRAAPQIDAAVDRSKGLRGSVSVDSAAILIRLP